MKKKEILVISILVAFILVFPSFISSASTKEKTAEEEKDSPLFKLRSLKVRNKKLIAKTQFIEGRIFLNLPEVNHKQNIRESLAKKDIIVTKLVGFTCRGIWCISTPFMCN